MPYPIQNIKHIQQNYASMCEKNKDYDYPQITNIRQLNGWNGVYKATDGFIFDRDNYYIPPRKIEQKEPEFPSISAVNYDKMFGDSIAFCADSHITDDVWRRIMKRTKIDVSAGITKEKATKAERLLVGLAEYFWKRIENNERSEVAGLFIIKTYRDVKVFVYFIIFIYFIIFVYI